MKKLIPGVHVHGRSSTKKGRTLTLFAPKRKKKRVPARKATAVMPELFEFPVAMA